MDKYRASRDGEISKKDQMIESGTKGSRIAIKGYAAYKGGSGGVKLVDKAANTKYGQEALYNSGKVAASSPILGNTLKKADDGGLLDKVENALDDYAGVDNNSELDYPSYEDYIDESTNTNTIDAKGFNRQNNVINNQGVKSSYNKSTSSQAKRSIPTKSNASNIPSGKVNLGKLVSGKKKIFLIIFLKLYLIYYLFH